MNAGGTVGIIRSGVNPERRELNNGDGMFKKI